MNKVSDDEDLSSDERSPVDQDIQAEQIGAASKTTTEEADFSSAELSVGYKTTAKPQMSESVCESSLYSRDSSKSTTQKESDQRKKKNDSKIDDTPMDLEVDTKEDECRIPLGTPKRKIEVSGYTAQHQQVNYIPSNISKPIHMTIRCF